MTAAPARHRVVVVGGGITGLACALEILDRDPGAEVTVVEASSTVGGVIRTSEFAGLAAVDEGADAWLVRVPWANDLASRLGLADGLVHPTGAHASVWRSRLHPIPAGLLLGVPAGFATIARGSLLSPVGKVRAAIEPLLPRRGDPHDSLGSLVRARFGREVHERLVDPLVGSIYAADTDSFSLEAVPQIAALTGTRSLLVAAARARRHAPVAGPVFAAPDAGMGSLCARAAAEIAGLGGTIRTRWPVESLARDAAGGEIRVTATTGEEISADSVVVAVPARVASRIVAGISTGASRALGLWEHASVVMVTLAIPPDQWPGELVGSGYLVPKPEQRWVTAASFGSNKWRHWRPADGSMILRVSLGRDRLEMGDHNDETVVTMALADLKRHLNRDFLPSAVRVTRWPGSFPQYRPGHFSRLAALESSLAADTAGAVVLAGASYRGIGVPACVQQGVQAARSVVARAASRGPGAGAR